MRREIMKVRHSTRAAERMTHDSDRRCVMKVFMMNTFSVASEGCLRIETDCQRAATTAVRIYASDTSCTHLHHCQIWLPVSRAQQAQTDISVGVDMLADVESDAVR